MRKADVKVDNDGDSFLSRQQAVLRVLRSQVIQSQLTAGALEKDRVSLIKIQAPPRDAAEAAAFKPVPFALFPMSASLERKLDEAVGQPAGAGPYLPALEQLVQLVKLADPYLSPYATTNVLFLSDGKPSDAVHELELPRRLATVLHELRAAVPEGRLALNIYGCGDIVSDADTWCLRQMKAALPECATFEMTNSKKYGELEETLKSGFSTTLAASRISSVSEATRRLPLRMVSRPAFEREVTYDGVRVFLPSKRLADFKSPLRPFLSRNNVSISVSNRILGHGGERNAYMMHFKDGGDGFTERDEEWVVKESRHEFKRAEDERDFHQKALITQKAAEDLAKEFNQQAKELGLTGLPEVAYMTCCFIETGKMTRETGEPAEPKEPPRRSLFAERHIRGQFRKWNTNVGSVVTTEAPPQEDVVAEHDDGGQGQRWRINSDDVPQAFSHFTIDFCQRPNSQFRLEGGEAGACLVCDLQGCYSKSTHAFKLIDPVIHSDLGVKNLFGATDRGAKGIEDFLKSHKCNEVCRMMELTHNSKFVAENISSTERSSVNTSIITVRATDHLKEREIERAVERREQQKAVKRGEKERTPSGTIKHHHDGVKMVTTPDFKGGVTVMRSGRYRTELCKWWERGNCKNGDRCTYAHGVHELRGADGLLLHPPPPGSEPPAPPPAPPPPAAPAYRGLAAAEAPPAAPAYRNLAAAEGRSPPGLSQLGSGGSAARRAVCAHDALPVPAAEEAWQEAPKPAEEGRPRPRWQWWWPRRTLHRTCRPPRAGVSSGACAAGGGTVGGGTGGLCRGGGGAPSSGGKGGRGGGGGGPARVAAARPRGRRLDTRAAEAITRRGAGARDANHDEAYRPVRVAHFYGRGEPSGRATAL